jgi:hypothetical protein
MALQRDPARPEATSGTQAWLDVNERYPAEPAERCRLALSVLSAALRHPARPEVPRTTKPIRPSFYPAFYPDLSSRARKGRAVHPAGRGSAESREDPARRIPLCALVLGLPLRQLS